MSDQLTDSQSEASALWNSAYALMTQNPQLSIRDRSILKDITPAMVFDSMIVLVAPNDYTRIAIENQLDEPVQSALTQAAGRPMSFVIKIRSNRTPSHPAPVAVPSTGRISTPPATAPQQQKDTPSVAHDSPTASTSSTPQTPTSQTSAPWGSNPSEPSSVSRESAGDTRKASVDAGSPDTQTPDTRNLDAHSQPAEHMTHATQDVLQGFGNIGDDSLLPSKRRPAAAKNHTAGSAHGRQQKEIAFHRDEKSHLNKDATFDNFVPGESNRFARAAAFAVSEAPGNSYNPLFIYGGSGLGKTHLLNAIGNYALNLYPDLKVRYVNSEEFTNEFINAVKEGAGSDGQITEFNRRYREVDLLLIDDIQFLGGKTETVNTFFHTFNALYNANKQIVVASDVSPKLLQGFEQRLISRFEMGLTVDVQPPNQETRIAILRMKASTSKLKMDVPMEVLDLIAQQVTDNIRELEGALTRVVAMASLNKQPVTTALAEQTLQDYFVSDVQVTPTDIISQTAAYFQLTFDDLVSARRSKNIALARQVAMYICREMTGLSLTSIGEIFGGRDHTTVIHAYQKISSEMSEKREVYNYVNELTSKLKQRIEK